MIGTADAAGVFQPTPATDEFGVGQVGSTRLGWLGDHERFAVGGSLGLIRMGVRLYDPSVGRFTSVDPVEGGCRNDYVYVEDPINGFDLDGRKCPGWVHNLFKGLGAGDFARAARLFNNGKYLDAANLAFGEQLEEWGLKGQRVTWNKLRKGVYRGLRNGRKLLKLVRAMSVFTSKLLAWKVTAAATAGDAICVLSRGGGSHGLYGGEKTETAPAPFGQPYSPGVSA